MKRDMSFLRFLNVSGSKESNKDMYNHSYNSITMIIVAVISIFFFVAVAATARTVTMAVTAANITYNKRIARTITTMHETFLNL